MRRSESIYIVNSIGRRGGSIQGRVLFRRGQDLGRGILRFVVFLFYIVKIRKDVGRGVSRSFCMLVVLRLINMDRERDKFFQFYYIYNLQFEYQEFMFTVVLEKYCEVFGQFIYQVSLVCLFYFGFMYLRGLV